MSTTVNIGTFAFSCEETCRLSNLHSKYIEELLKAYNINYSPHWMQTLPKPAKPNLAETLWRATNAEQHALIAQLLPDMEKQNADEERNKRGRPVMKWQNGTPMAQRARQHEPVIEDIETVQRIVEQFTSSEAPQAEQVHTTQTNRVVPAAPASDDPLYLAVRAVVLQVMQTAEVRSQSVDSAQVQQIVRDAMRDYHAPTVVEIRRPDTVETESLGVQHKQFATLLQLVQVNYPVWIPGPAGSGKTTAVLNAAKALDATLYMPPEGPVENKYGMIGFVDAGGTFQETTLYKACKEASENPEKRVIYFIDECDAGYPNALMVLNAVMENKYCTFANGERIHFGSNLQFIAGANTYGNGATHEYVGRNRLDGATLDRFITLAWDYDEDLERAISHNDTWVAKVQRIRREVRAMGIKHIVSPRASIRGAALLAAGFNEDSVLAMTVYKGMSTEQIASVQSRIR